MHVAYLLCFVYVHGLTQGSTLHRHTEGANRYQATAESE